MSNKKDVGDTSLARNEFEALHSFQRIMWDKLMANTHKGGWGGAEPLDLFARLEGEGGELALAIDAYILACNMTITDPNHPRIVAARVAVAKECADVANFAMMIADVVGGLPYQRRNGG